jgi:hypothetical protein
MVNELKSRNRYTTKLEVWYAALTLPTKLAAEHHEFQMFLTSRPQFIDGSEISVDRKHTFQSAICVIDPRVF